MLIQKRLSGVVAHRGSQLKAPENTMAAFRQAEADGARTFELDVSETSDVRSVVHHDDTLDRTTDGSGPVDQHSLEEVMKLDAGSWFSPQFAGEKVPQLEDVLSWAKDRMHVDVEIKPHAATPEYADRLLAILKEQGMEQQVTVSSFSRPFLELLEEKAPQIDTGLLLTPVPTIKPAAYGAAAGLVAGLAGGFAATGSILGTVAGAVVGTVGGALAGRHLASGYVRDAAKNSTADHILPHWLLAGPGLIRRSHKQGKNVLPYTVNSEFKARVLKTLGVDGLITDRPETMLKHFPN